ncbi:MAG TPA: hypothetical protein VJY34_02790 [Roseiarcus sp.]|nr:hypothetical protein [Roseiarcus sp.]
MTPQEAGAILSPTHRRALRAAYLILERPDFAARLGDLGGRPVHEALRATPRIVEARLTKAVEAALQRALNVAIFSLAGKPATRPRWRWPARAARSAGSSGRARSRSSCR